MSRHLAIDTATCDLAEATEAAARRTDPAYLASFLVALRNLHQDLRGYMTDVERALLLEMDERDERRLEVPGVGVIERHHHTKRSKWDYDSLIPVLVARALDEREVDPETGEFREREAHTVARVLRECVSFSGGKVTGLRARGIAPDEFAEETPDGWSVQLPPRDHQEDAA